VGQPDSDNCGNLVYSAMACMEKRLLPFHFDDFAVKQINRDLLLRH